MLDYTEQIARALSGDAAAFGALFSETVATVYYSSLKITGTASAARLITVRTYLLAFRNLSRLAYPQVFPVWLDRISVYLACHAAGDRNSGSELDEARQQLVAFLRDFHRMGDAEIAELLAVEERAVAACEVRSEALNTEEFLLDRDTVLGIWHDVWNHMASVPAPAAAQQPDALSQKAPAHAAPPQRSGGNPPAEMRKKRSRRRMLRIGAGVLVCLLLAGVVFGALHAQQSEPDQNDRQVARLADTLSLQLSGQVGEIYQLSDDMYFVSINLGYGGVEGLIVQYELAENAIRLSSPDGGELTQSELEKITGERYMQVLYNPTVVGSSAAVAGALDAKPGEAPALPPQASASPVPTKTPVAGDGSSFEMVEAAGDFSIMLRINCRNVDFTRPMTIVLDSAISKAIGEAGGLQIVLNDLRHCITLSTEQLTALCSAYGSVTLRFSAQGDRQYSIAFYSEDGKKITELFSTMTFTLPADGPMTYVFAIYDSGTESRGGVYDRENETVSFPVRLSGLYQLIGSETEIRDRAAMDDETAEAAFFLSSLEFMQLDAAGNFRPDDRMTRNEAVGIIGRMFLATDPNLTSGYPDVNLDDPSYDYITFGTTSSILTGLGDGTFHGEADISREELLTICGRTLLYRGGEETGTADVPLGFDDESELANYARPAVSALLEHEILRGGGLLRPKVPATRGEAAVLLYRMYCELYGYRAE